MRPFNVNYDGGGWNADFVAGLTEEEFVQQFAGTIYGHIGRIDERIKACELAYRFIVGQYRKIHPKTVEKPVKDDE